MKKVLIFFSFLIYITAFIYLFFLVYPFCVEEKVFVVNKGESAVSICRRLREERIIRSEPVFLSFLRITKKDRSIKRGEYEFRGRLSALDVIDKLVSGRVKLYKITIPEGNNLYEISERVYPVCEKDVFLKLVFSEEYARSLGINAPRLEGYLFPETYTFDRYAGCEKVISTMVRKTFEVFTNEYKKRADELGMSMHEVLTLASIIEKETSVKEEMPLISAVFHNRLRMGMRLYADPTVIYGLLPHFNGNLTKDDLRTFTPYNTYLIKGLPPTPICSAGKDAIESALYPADVPYLFFVSKNDGTHIFSKTLKEHNYYVKIYQKKDDR